MAAKLLKTSSFDKKIGSFIKKGRVYGSSILSQHKITEQVLFFQPLVEMCNNLTGKMFNVVEEIWYESLRVQPYSQGFIIGCLTLLITSFLIGYFVSFELFQLRFLRNRNIDFCDTDSIASFDKQTQNPSGNTNTLDQRLKEMENKLTSLRMEDEQLKVSAEHMIGYAIAESDEGSEEGYNACVQRDKTTKELTKAEEELLLRRREREDCEEHADDRTR